MEKKLDFGLKMSLEQLALRKVTVNVWNENDILVSIQEYLSSKCSKLRIDRSPVWRNTVEVKVKEKISELVLIEPQKKQMALLIRPMGLDLLKWKKFHEKYLPFISQEFNDLLILKQLVRNDKGVIDYKETAAKLVHLPVINVMNRYHLACLYCLVDSIQILFEQLPSEFKSIACNEQHTLPITELNLDFYWAYILQGKESKMNYVYRLKYNISYNQFAFERSASRGNKAATEYFFEKLTTVQLESFLFEVICNATSDHVMYRSHHSFPIEKVPEVVCYLLTLIHPEKQLQVFKKNFRFILNIFLEWPWQDFFLDILDIMWTFIPENCYDALLGLFNEKVIKLGYFPKFVKNLFLRSPVSFRKTFARYSETLIFTQLFDEEDTDTIKVIFRNLEFKDRGSVVYSYTGLRFLETFKRQRNKRHLIRLCLREATLSKEDKEKLKQTFVDVKLPLEQFLDEIYSLSENKRRSEGETLSSFKKICR